MFLGYREVAACGSAAGCSGLALAGFALATALGVPAAVALARVAVEGRAPAWCAPQPDDATLATLAGIVAAVDAYLLLSLADAVPPAVEGLATPLGLLLGLPLVAVQLAVVAAGNALVEPPSGVGLLVVAVGVALSAAWWYVLAAGAGRLVALASPAGLTRR